jgi:DNA primase
MFYNGEYIRQLKCLVDPVQLLLQVGQISPSAIREGADEIRCPCPLHGGDNQTAFLWKKSVGTWVCFTRHCGESIKRHDVYGFLQIKLHISFSESVQYLEKFLGVTDQNRNTLLNNMHEKTSHLSSKAARLKQYEVKKTETLKYLPYFYKEAFNYVSEYLLSRNYRYSDIDIFNFYPAKDSFGLIRLGIPIYDEDSNLVGVSCRLMDTIIEYPKQIVLQNGNSYPVPKYRMSKFNKGSILYNLHNVKQESFKSGILVVEGQFDVARLYTYGIKNAVCCMGSFLTNNQVALLYKYTYHTTFLVEEGEAAMRGVLQSIKKFNPQSMRVSIAKLPSGDADSNMKETVINTLSKATTLSTKDIIEIQEDKNLDRYYE